MRFPELRPRMPLAGAALAACGGIVGAEFITIGWPLWGASVLLSIAVLVWRRVPALCWLTVALTFATLHALGSQENPGHRLAALFEPARGVKATGVVITEPEKPPGFSRSTTARFRLRLEEVETSGQKYSVNAVVQVRWAGEFPSYGDRVEVRGNAANLQPARNPGQFDFRNYARRQGVYSEISARYGTDCRILGKGFGNPLQTAAFKSRRWISEKLAMDLEDDPATADLIASMVLGMRGETPEELQELFRTTGTLHLFAVSGLNVAMLAAIAWFLLKPLRISRRTAIFLTIPLLLFYAMITGLSASCVRATIMCCLLLGGFLFDRPPSVYNTLGAAALLVLGWDTNQFFAPGAQFSFALVLALAWFSRPIEKRLEPFGRPDDFLPRALWTLRMRLQYFGWNQFAATLGVTLAAWLGSMAFTAAYFNLFSLSAIAANMVAVPLAFSILILGLISTITAPLFPPVAILFNNANWLCAKTLVASVQFCAGLPQGHMYVNPTITAPPAFEYTVFDLDDGGAVHLRSAREEWLVDCGHRFEYERIVLPYLRSRGIDQIDALVLTHGDAQHIGAAQDAWHDLQPQALYDLALKDRSPTRRALHSTLAEQQFGKRLAARGDILQVGGDLKIEVLYPPRGLQRSLADDKAMVLRVSAGGFRTLLMSDSGFSTEQWLLENEPDLRADVLVKGWHSRDASVPSNLLAKVQPQAVVLGAAGYGGKVTLVDEFAEEARRRGAAAFRQDQTGAVQAVITSEGGLRLRAFLTGLEVTLRPAQ